MFHHSASVSQVVPLPAKNSQDPVVPSGRQVERAVFLEALQHPTTLIPGAVAVLSAGFAAMFHADPLAITVAAGAFLLTAASWAFHYLVRGESLAKRHVQKVLDRRQRARDQRLDALIDAAGEAYFKAGVEAGVELRDAYLKLRDQLAEREGANRSRTAMRFASLAEDCYREGAALLEKALTNHRVIRGINRAKLQSELAGWRHQAGELATRIQRGEPLQTRFDALQKKIVSNERRLDLYKQRQDMLEQWLAECEVLESALESAYLEVADLLSGRHAEPHGQAASHLEQAVAAARRAEDRLSGLEQSLDTDEDRMYREAGTDARGSQSRVEG